MTPADEAWCQFHEARVAFGLGAVAVEFRDTRTGAWSKTVGRTLSEAIARARLLDDAARSVA